MNFGSEKQPPPISIGLRTNDARAAQTNTSPTMVIADALTSSQRTLPESGTKQLGNSDHPFIATLSLGTDRVWSNGSENQVQTRSAKGYVQ